MSIHNTSSSDKYIDVKKVLTQLLKNWIWYAISIAVCIIVAFVSVKIVQPKYLISSSIYIKEDMGMEGQKAMDFIQSFSLFDQKNDYQNEMLILNSSPLIRQTIEKLNLETEYYEKSNLINKEVYKYSPFIVMIDSLHNQIINTPFHIVFKEDGKFILSAEKKEYAYVNYSKGKKVFTENTLNIEGEYFQSNVIEGEDYKFRIFLNENIDLSKIAGKEYSFMFFDKESLVRRYQSLLEVEPVNPEVSVVAISLRISSRQKGVDFIRTLTEIYLQKNLERKNHLALNTIDYINDQLEQISDSLSFAESKLESFRASNQVMDINTKAARVLERLQQLEIEKSTTERAYNYYKYLDEYFQQGDDYSEIVVPSSMGVTNNTLNEFIRDLLILSNQRDDLIDRNQQKSPYLKNLEVKIENLRNSIVENIRFSKESLKREMDKFGDQIKQLEKQIESLPKTERQLVGIERKFQINDAIYTFLLQKRAEAQIAKAGNLPEHEVVEPARVLAKVYPNPKIHFMFAIFMALLIPTLILIVKDFIDDRIKNEDAITDNYNDIPFLGTIIKNANEKQKLIVHDDPKSVIAETFRTIRTNLFFFMKKEEHKTLLVSSCIAGEGKSFVAFNLAASLAALGKKTIIVGFDLRKKGQFSEFDHNAKVGLSSYYLQDKTIKEIIKPSQAKDLDYISPGVIPPNPLELIGNKMTDELFLFLKKEYDYIVVDTPPVGVLSDGYLLMKHSDVSLFVVREKYTGKHILNSVLKEIKQKGFQNIGLLLNGSRMEGRRYRYDYYTNYNSK